MARCERFIVETASEEDVPEIYALVFQNPEEHICRLEIPDVERLVDDGVLWVAREIQQQRIVGVCYIKVPHSQVGKEPEPAEYGGAFVDKAYRRKGIGKVLAKVAIARYFWDNDPDSPTLRLPLVAHVHITNPKPRTILSELGFEYDKTITVPEGVLGFGHMPKDNDGKIRGDEFKFKSEERISLYRTVAELLNDSKTEAEDGSVSEFDFNIGLGFLSAALLELADHLESTM